MILCKKEAKGQRAVLMKGTIILNGKFSLWIFWKP